jgi:hypothetical protein
MRSLDGTVLGPWSPKFTFVTGTTTGIGSIQATNTLAVYPNPANDVISIRLPETINGKINLRIEDLSGKLVADENYFISSLDKRILNKDISTLTNGMYLIHVMQDGLTYQSKFQKK